MKKKMSIFLIIIVVLLTVYFVSKTFNAKMQLKTKIKEGEITEVNSFQKDNDDNFIIAGRTEKKAFISKYDSKFNEVWTKKQEGSPMTSFSSVAILKNNDYVTVGEVWKIPGFDGIISYYDKDGDLVWSRRTSESFLNTIIEYKDYLYILGTTEKDNNKYISLIKYTLTGNEVWTRLFSGENLLSPKDITIENDEIIIVGSDATFTDGIKNYSFIIKYDTNGRKIFESVTNEVEDIQYRSVITTPNGYLVSGYESNEDYTLFKGILVKYDKNGNKQWSKYTSNENDPENFNSKISKEENGYIITELYSLSTKNKNLFELIRSGFGAESIEHVINTITINDKEEITKTKNVSTINAEKIIVLDSNEIYSIKKVSEYTNIYLFKINSFGIIKALMILIIAISIITFILLKTKKNI